MAPPHTMEEYVRHRVVTEDEVQPKQQFERNYEPLMLSIKEIRDTIPAHCFERSTAHSIMHVVKDLATIAVIFYAATWIDTLPYFPLRASAWIAYWILQGIVMTGPWILAHECGHGAFSDNATVNTIFGWVLHSALLVPYQAWKMSHSKHHKGTGSMTKDVVFIPATRSYKGLPPLKPEQGDHYHEESVFSEAPIVTILSLVFILTLGWPLYLIMNFGGQTSTHWIHHFKTIAPLFEPHQAKDIFYSNCGVGIMVAILGYMSYITSPMAVFIYYGIPYLGVNAWIVCITYLQHTDPDVPHFRNGEWNFQRGAACTIDRSFGRLINHFHHHIADSHVAHHMFSQMPFYHAVEATKYLKETLGKHYHYDDTPIAKALYRNWRTCKFVEDEGEVVFYKH